MKRNIKYFVNSQFWICYWKLKKGKIEIQNEIGKGAFGTVYLGKYKSHLFDFYFPEKKLPFATIIYFKANGKEF